MNSNHNAQTKNPGPGDLLDPPVANCSDRDIHGSPLDRLLTAKPNILILQGEYLAEFLTDDPAGNPSLKLPPAIGGCIELTAAVKASSQKRENNTVVFTAEGTDWELEGFHAAKITI